MCGHLRSKKKKKVIRSLAQLFSRPCLLRLDVFSLHQHTFHREKTSIHEIYLELILPMRFSLCISFPFLFQYAQCDYYRHIEITDTYKKLHALFISVQKMGIRFANEFAA